MHRPEDEISEEIAISDEVSRFLGNYITSFQFIESQLNQILQLALGFQNWRYSRIVFAELSNRSKISCVRSIINDALADTKDKFRLEWLVSFNNVMRRTADEAATRNQLVHGIYDYTIAKHGGPVLLFYNRVAKQGLSDKSIPLSSTEQLSILSTVAELARDISLVRLQIVSWSVELFEKADSSPKHEPGHTTLVGDAEPT
ncbi:MAG: hypothetical protein EP335_14365 [Alphaproteobacteria bacterium]|nr:MAG: hypothetical protein EP335_14365 [Alphaproteobacteria bacterium]